MIMKTTNINPIKSPSPAKTESDFFTSHEKQSAMKEKYKLAAREFFATRLLKEHATIYAVVEFMLEIVFMLSEIAFVVVFVFFRAIVNSAIERAVQGLYNPFAKKSEPEKNMSDLDFAKLSSSTAQITTKD